MPPQVRDIQELIHKQNQALDPQYALLNEAVAQNDQAGKAQELGLTAKKDQAFTDITQTAQNKGMMFSGFTPDEQAKYTASTYLPALAQLQATIASTRGQLLGKKAELMKSGFDIATQQQEGDIQFLNQWNKMTAEQQFNASEAEKQRAFTAAEAAKERTFTSSENAANRSSQAAAAKAQGAPPDLVDGIYSLLESKKGADTFVSPETYRAGMQKWVRAGGTPDEYNATYSGYINPVHQQQFGGYF